MIYPVTNRKASHTLRFKRPSQEQVTVKVLYELVETGEEDDKQTPCDSPATSSCAENPGPESRLFGIGPKSEPCAGSCGVEAQSEQAACALFFPLRVARTSFIRCIELTGAPFLFSRPPLPEISHSGLTPVATSPRTQKGPIFDRAAPAHSLYPQAVYLLLPSPFKPSI